MLSVATAIEGVSLEVTPDYLWLSSTRPLRLLSSGVVGDELMHARHVLSTRVSLRYENRAPEGDLLARAAGLGIGEPFVGMLTAVDLSKAVTLLEQDGDLRVLAVVTVGVGNASAAGSVTPGGAVAGTINVVLVVDADVTRGALVNAVITATEAKTLALLAAGVRTPEGEQASGTSSDAIAVACTGQGRKLRYAGPATTVGLLIGRAVRGAVAKGLGSETGATKQG